MLVANTTFDLIEQLGLFRSNLESGLEASMEAVCISWLFIAAIFSTYLKLDLRIEHEC